MAKLTPAQIEGSHAWLYDVFAVNNITGGKSNIRSRWYYDYDWQRVMPDAKVIYNAIKFRNVSYQDFVNIDNALNNFSNVHFIPTLDPSRQNTRCVKKPAHILAAYIANFCAEHNIYWDNTLETPFEMDEIKKTTIGNALWEYCCFLTQEAPAGKPVRVAGTRTPGQAPQNGYKSLGGLSSKVPTLVGQPGQKLGLNSSFVYCIEADKLGKNTPCIFVTPVSSAGDAVDSTKAAKVNIGSGNGYSDCKLWWDDINNANTFLSYCQTKFGNGKFQNLHIAKARPDSNGYFEVSTEFGNAYIKASRLNEEICEWLDVDIEEALAECINNDQPIEENCDLEEAKKKAKTKATGKYKINNIDTYDEAFDKYRD